MDPLSMTAGIAGLASLAIQVAPALHDYIATVKGAERDIGWYVDEVDSLIEVCKRLEDFLRVDVSSPEARFTVTDSVLGRTVSSCEACLDQLGKLLQGPAGWTQKIKWPLRKKKVEEIIKRLARYTNMFQFALTVEGHAIFSNTPEVVEELLDLQVKASSKLHEITKGIDALLITTDAYRSTAESTSSLLEGIRSLSATNGQIASIQKDVGDIKTQLNDSYDMELLEWLSPEHGRGRHAEVRSRRTPGTGKWFLEMPDFQNWLDKQSAPAQRILWLVGDPGCGKSTLLSLAVDELSSSCIDKKAVVAYHYCDYRAHNASPLTAAMGRLLRMLLERSMIIPPILRDIFQKARREGRAPDPSELKCVLISVAGSFDRCFILVDAMDEFSISDAGSTSEFVRILDELAEFGVNVFVTSRAIPSPPLTTGHYIATIRADEADIRSYVAFALSTDHSLIDIIDQSLERDITQTVVEQAKGMFLLAVLHLQNIRGQVTRSGVRKALKSLSGSLSDAYEKTFECIKYQSQARQKLAFDSMMWVSSSYRPLNSLELQHALATQPEDEEWDPDNLPSLRLIIASCCGLLAVDSLDIPESEVHLVHHTLHHYLQDSQPEWKMRANILITQVSLKYLHFASMAKGTQESENRETPLILTSFVCDNRGHHAMMMPPKLYINAALNLLQNQDGLQTLYPGKFFTGLHIASRFGLTHLVSNMLNQTSRFLINKMDDSFETPLHKACANNHFSTAFLLLQRGADPNEGRTTSSLYISVMNNNLPLAKLLLDSGATPDTKCTDSWTALHKAADSGYPDLVELLVLRGSSLSQSSARGLTALHRAAGRGHIEVITYLLSHGAKLDCTSDDGWTPLHGAASAGQTRAVLFLLISLVHFNEQCSGGDNRGIVDRAGGFDFQTDAGRTPLHLACQGGHVNTVEVLLASRARVLVADEDGDLPLHIASREGNVGVMKCLLREEDDRSAQLVYRNDRGRTPLEEAQLNGTYEAEQMLWKMSGGMSLDSDADEEELISAIRMDDAQKVTSLLGLVNEQKPSQQSRRRLEMRNQGGRTPLQQAVLFGSLHVSRALLSSGADIHARSDPGYWTPLHYAAMLLDEEAVGLCLSHGADLDARTQQEQTSLHHACRRGAEGPARMLLEKGADVEAIDDRGWRAVHIAAAGGYLNVIVLLLEHGDSGKPTVYGQQIQGCASERGHHGVVEMLRKLRYSWLTTEGDYRIDPEDD
ncbi:hypothetical protein PENCOP_c005G07897 [Penicillium coprophilum]|uniref:Uncharacterized protein n=1 Tax=Penicillium coprophilum TaxID=36646 RepID=A0A1V6USP7_9EURO|nr:hypothetical protein PENCOP_c005G07897 [Penicillium coprophilum]